MFQSLIGRLQTTYMRFPRARKCEFQSLIGRLQTCIDFFSCIKDCYPFQSLIGRLQTGSNSSHHFESSDVVSIPHR